MPNARLDNNADPQPELAILRTVNFTWIRLVQYCIDFGYRRALTGVAFAGIVLMAEVKA